MAHRKPLNIQEVIEVAEMWLNRRSLVDVTAWVLSDMEMPSGGIYCKGDDDITQWSDIENCFPPIVCEHCGEEIDLCINAMLTNDRTEEWLDKKGDPECYDTNGNSLGHDHEPENEDPDPVDVVQWFAVDKEFFELASEAKEVVIANDYGYFWGRASGSESVALESFIMNWAKGLAWIKEAEVSNLWNVTAHFSVAFSEEGKGQYRTAIQIPTFVLDGDIQGFTDEKGCERIARKVLGNQYFPNTGFQLESELFLTCTRRY